MDKQCEQCKAQFSTREAKRRFCSKKCFYLWRRIFLLGKNNYFYGRKHSTKTKKLLSRLKLGGIPWNKDKGGYTWTEARWKAQEKRTGYCGRKPVIKNGKEYSDDWHEIRRIIYKRDNWYCQECGCKCLDKRYKNTKNKIQCHHIDYNEKNNNHDNLITLCASCHMKTNFNREDWIKYFNNKERKKSNG